MSRLTYPLSDFTLLFRKQEEHLACSDAALALCRSFRGYWGTQHILDLNKVDE